MKPTTLIQLIVLPTAIAANFAELYIVAGKDEGIIRVTGKVDPEAEVKQTNYTTTDFDQNTQCLHDDGTWSRWGCQQKPMYRQIGQINFANATKEPRGFVIEFPDRDVVGGGYLVTLKETSLTQVCKVTVTGGGSYTWSPIEGRLDQETNNAIKVECSGNLTELDVYDQKTSGTQWEKDLWAAVLPVSDALEAERNAVRQAQMDEIYGQTDKETTVITTTMTT